METRTVFLILLALITAIVLIYFQYFFKEGYYKNRLVLAFLRFVSIFLILVLLINPKMEKKTYTIFKPKLMLAIDNSSSIAFTKQDTLVKKLLNQFKANKQINNRFDLSYFTFGNALKSGDNFNFQDNQTNIYQALKKLNALEVNQTVPIILLSDGNQTYGNDYRYYNSKQPIYPIIIGDTAQYSDLIINRINVNKYAHLDNNFEVEIFVNFSGNKKAISNLIVEQNKQVVFSQKLKFSKDNKSAIIQFKLTANKLGKLLYKVKLTPFKEELNMFNNYKNFSVEVIDEQTKIALVYDALHPDIGMLKRVIETNKQRKVNLINLNALDNFQTDADVFILYQPNNKFDKMFSVIASENKNYFIITGKQTDWNFLNMMQSDFKKTNTSVFESYYASYNADFNLFNIEDIGFADFPPVDDVFGEIKFSVPFQSLLLQNSNGIETKTPLLAVISYKSKRRVILFGENSWKWRALSYSYNQSFEKYDQFLNNIMQFLSISKKSTPIELTYNTLNYANQPIKIIAKTYDDNLNFDINAHLELFIEGEEKGIPFQLKNNLYEVQIADLKSGDYNFMVKNVRNSNQVNGLLTVAKFAIEHENKTSNVGGLKALAINSKGKSYYPSQVNEVIKYLTKNQDYVSIQKENKKMISFIDWKWVLSLIILSLSLEWFIRKYKGLV